MCFVLTTWSYNQGCLNSIYSPMYNELLFGVVAGRELSETILTDSLTPNLVLQEPGRYSVCTQGPGGYTTARASEPQEGLWDWTACHQATALTF